MALAGAGDTAVAEIDRGARPEIFYHVVLHDAPLAGRLELRCEWVDPGGRVARHNSFRTRMVYKRTWPTHCRQQFGPAMPEGAWQVRLLSGERVSEQRAVCVEVILAVSGICGFVGQADPQVVDAMLAAIAYRGDRHEVVSAPGVSLGYRWWSGRPGKSPGIHREGDDVVACAGTFAPPVDSPAAALRSRLVPGPAGLDTLDGAFGAAWWDGARKRLTLIRDPFGVRSLYYTEHDGVFYFASELKQLLAIPSLPVEADPVALHKYLTFSFVPGEDVPIRGIRRLLPGHVAEYAAGRLTTRPYFTLREEIDPRLADRKVATRHIRARCREAIGRRLNGESEVAVFLSGGIDSSGVTLWLTETGVKVRAFSLDFGDRSVEKSQAQAVADQLQVPIAVRAGQRRRHRRHPAGSGVEARPAVRRSRHRAAIPARTSGA